MHRLISGLLVVLCIAVWGVALVVYLEAAYFTSADGIPLRMKVSNIISCPHCHGRFVSQDSGLHFHCLDCGEFGGEACLSNRESSFPSGPPDHVMGLFERRDQEPYRLSAEGVALQSPEARTK